MLLNSASTATNPKKSLTKVHESDIERSMQYSRRFLQILGVWPMISKNASTTEKYFSKIVIVVLFIAMNFSLVPLSLDTILRENNSFVILCRILGPISASLSVIFKYVFIIIRCKDIRLCIEHMESDWMEVEKENERAIMMRNVDIGRRLTIIACAFMYTSTTFYLSIVPFLKGTKINERNQTIRPLPYPGYDFFVDPQKSPAYEIIFFTTCATGLVRYTVTMTAYNFAVVLVTHACGQIQIIMARLEGLFDGIEEGKCSDTLEERISSVIHCHVKGLRFAKVIDDVLREICFIEIVATTVILCLVEYTIQSGWNNSQTIEAILALLLLISYIFNLFIFCYIGELLKEQYYQIGKSSYFIEWYNLPGRTGLAVVMIIAIANIPRKITAGRMIELSVASFGMIMRTSAAYVNMMRTMAD